MKAHIAAPPVRVLTYGLDDPTQEGLANVLDKLKSPQRKVDPRELGEMVGCLAGFPGYSAKGDQELQSVADSSGVLCISGLSGAKLDRLLQALRQEGVSIPLKAVVTPTNQRWTFLQLIQELQREHEAVTQGHQAHPAKDIR